MARAGAVLWAFYELRKIFVWQFAHIRPDLNLQEDGERKDFLDERSIDDLTEDFANDPPLRAGCKCDNGKCVKKDGKKFVNALQNLAT
ncbi:hypothetical protein TNCV_944261 [Trichonephila clavipes]|nr:hypothetical protein TNCV_944261 [Trichonephila clavipes]